MDPGWEEIYAARCQRLVALVAVLAESLGETEEAVQDAFVQALGRRVDRIDDPEAWLYRVAVNRVRSRWRRALVARKHLGRIAAEPDDRAQERFNERDTLRRMAGHGGLRRSHHRPGLCRNRTDGGRFSAHPITWS